ncbi:hypothetical protein [Seonamhaeicola maritimus]|uniref:hypothetical protein n=1 Tax=Seonamhaeicola maritimus TaxID=2591822 RepID=UPI002493D990|nr:hypothetical protein [Seonamhaeicola maritimus]
MNHRISIKRIIIDLLSIKEQVVEHFKDDQKYHVLINYLLTDKKINDEDSFLPTFKEIESATGIKVYHLRKQLTEIYNAYFEKEYDNSIRLNFSKCEVLFIIKRFGVFSSFICENLPHLPRIGENMDLPFVKAKVGCDFFYVEDIRHNLSGLTQTIDIYLKCGFYNAYWHNRLHEAKEKRELPWKDFYDLNDYELKEKLLK